MQIIPDFNTQGAGRVRGRFLVSSLSFGLHVTLVTVIDTHDSSLYSFLQARIWSVASVMLSRLRSNCCRELVYVYVGMLRGKKSRKKLEILKRNSIGNRDG